MAEFAGYVGNLVPPTDWGKIGNDLFDKYNKVKEERQAERTKIDDDYAESFSKIGDYEQTTDQNVNEFMFRGANDVRDGFKTQYDLLKKGAITTADYKLYKSTAMSDWSTLNKAVKNFGAVIANNQKLITEGKMSGLGQYNSLGFAELGNLKYAKIMMNPQTGRLYRANIDPKTGKIASDNDVYSPSAMLNPSNLVDLKVDVNSGVTSFLKNLGDYGIAKDLGNGRIEVTEDARKNPAYNKALDAQIHALTVTDRSTASILTDYVGEYKFFKSEAEKKDLISKGLTEDKLIKVERKNGVYEPILTDKQEAVAKDYVRNAIEVGVGHKESRTAGYAPNQPRETKGISDRERKDILAAQQAQLAFQSLKTYGDKSPYATLLLSSAAARNKESGPLQIGLLKRDVYEIGTNKKKKLSSGSSGVVLRDQNGNIVKDIQNPKDLYIFTNPGTSELESEASYDNALLKLGKQGEQRGSFESPNTPSRTRVSAEGWQ
jgi:hypothetical protein